MDVSKACKPASAAFAKKRIGMAVRVAAGCMGIAFMQTGWAQAQSQPAATVGTPAGTAAGTPAGTDATLPAIHVEGSASTGYGPLVEPDRVNDPRQRVTASKTGTRLEDLPANVQVIPSTLVKEQGGTMLRDAISNASGINYGGQDSKGYFDHFLIRGLNAQIYEDGFSDGEELGGISHSLNGVERVEILEGPGSALFGSGPPGGTINIVHYQPSQDFHYGGSVQAGSYGTVTNTDYITGPTGIAGLNYRVDATFSRSDGFRDLANRDYEVRPELQWDLGRHKIQFSLDLRDTHETPDSYGIIYSNGSPLEGVSRDAKFSTPFAFASQTYVRPTISDEWRVNDYLTINNRFSYLHRSVDVLANGDSSSTRIVNGQVVSRQLRQQDDSDNTFDYQLEPVWKFSTGSVGHTLLTGFEYQHQLIDTERSTADLPNIPDAFNPVPPETTAAALNFLCDAKHSCDNDHMVADYYSLYATDQIDVTDQLKVRAGVRQDWWDTSLTPNISVPGRFGSNGLPLLAGVRDTRNDAPVSWNLGALYKVLTGITPYFGISKSHFANFDSENTQNGIGAPESAMQYEVGVKFSLLNDRLNINTALFDVKRDNVAAATTINGIESVVFDSQKTKGAEASVDAAITPRWHVLANFTAQDAKITDNPQGIASVGNVPQGAPSYIANLWTSYDFSIDGIPGFHVGAGANYVSKTFSDITNVNSIPSYVIFNAAAGYETPHWGVDLNVHNLTDRRYFVAANGAGAFVGESLSAFVNLHANF
jgi:iron complex outermembrane recepter protein